MKPPIEECKVEEREVEATVILVIPEYHQAEMETPDGRRYALTRHVPGLALDDVREGQVYRCTVTSNFARVLSAELVKEPT